eukprot:1162048-Pelagomonas_calceolata.AAC.3
MSSQYLTSTRWMCLCSGRTHSSSELARVTYLEAGGVTVAGVDCFLFHPCHPLLLGHLQMTSSASQAHMPIFASKPRK